MISNLEPASLSIKREARTKTFSDKQGLQKLTSQSPSSGSYWKTSSPRREEPKEEDTAVLRVQGLLWRRWWKVQARIWVLFSENTLNSSWRLEALQGKGQFINCPTGNQYLRRKSRGFAVSPKAKLILTNQRFGKITAQSGNLFL